jgi:hypothetical protein
VKRACRNGGPKQSVTRFEEIAMKIDATEHDRATVKEEQDRRAPITPAADALLQTLEQAQMPESDKPNPFYCPMSRSPWGCHSGDSIHNTATWDNTTIRGLGLTPGTYIWTWGSGTTADFVEVDIPSPTAVPEPSSLTLLAPGALGLLGYGIRRRRQAAA